MPILLGDSLQHQSRKVKLNGLGDHGENLIQILICVEACAPDEALVVPEPDLLDLMPYVPWRYDCDCSLVILGVGNFVRRIRSRMRHSGVVTTGECRRKHTSEHAKSQPVFFGIEKKEIK